LNEKYPPFWVFSIENVLVIFVCMKIALSELKQIVFDKLDKELPKHLYYHSTGHVADVYEAAMRIADSEDIPPEGKTLLATAVLFHDTGFIYQNRNHEEKGCEIAQTMLPGLGYTPDEIETICGMIMATRIPQTPKTKLEQLICDADLDYLGRDDFWEIGATLYKEILATGIVMSKTEWNQLQIRFLESHQYFTATAIATRQAKKKEHLTTIHSLI
jgi:uncharacterized protein